MRRYMIDVYDIEWSKPNVEDCDWFCDNCNSALNDQEGFDYDCGTWKCAECGYENAIGEDDIRMDLPDSETFEIECEEYNIEDEITELLESKYGNSVIDFRFNIMVEEDSDDEDLSEDESMSDDDFELADFCRGGGLTKD